MSPAQPDGERWPIDGALHPDLVEADRRRPLSLYVHVPFCRVRCGYCDFNTYTVGFGPGAQVGDYAPSVLAEASLAARVMAEAGLPPRPALTVFFGGGTPTTLGAGELISILSGLRESIGIAKGAEVTLEANPDTVTRHGLRDLADAGFTRVSFGMQSAVPAILSTLDRTHSPERVPLAVEWAKEAGLSTSVDLIYGTPGESLADWEASLLAACPISPTTSVPTPLSSKKGRGWGCGSPGGSCPRPIPTTRPRNTNSPTRSWARRDTPGMRFPISRASPTANGRLRKRRRAARTHPVITWPTGATGTGGAWVPVLIPTWDAHAGGMSRIRLHTRDAFSQGNRPPSPGRFCPRRHGSWSVSCWGCVPPTGWRSRACRVPVGWAVPSPTRVVARRWARVLRRSLRTGCWTVVRR